MKSLIVDNMLKEIDDEYRNTLINFAKYKLVIKLELQIVKALFI